MDEENLNIIMARLNDIDRDVRFNAINMLIDLVKTSHSGSVNTLSFQNLNNKKSELLEICKEIDEEHSKIIFDIVSAISIIGDNIDILKYRIKGNVIPLKEWGHLYVKKLVGCIVDSKKGIMDVQYDATFEVSEKCIDFLFKNNLEFDAIDFLIELERIGVVVDYVEAHNYKRIILYLEEMAAFKKIDDVIYQVAYKMNDITRYVVRLINSCKYDEAISVAKGISDKRIKAQVLYILARSNVYYESEDPEEAFILKNLHLRDIYRAVFEKLELDDTKKESANLRKVKYEYDSKYLQPSNYGPITVANGFANFGSGKDSLFFVGDDEITSKIDYQSILDSDIIDLITIIGSFGSIEAFNPNRVLEVLQEYIFGETSSKKTGSLLALALASSKIYDPEHNFLSIISSNLNTNDPIHVIPTLLGIQSMYSTSRSEHIRELIQPYIFSENIEIGFVAAFTLGSVFAGSVDPELTSLLTQMFIEKEEVGDNQFFKFLMIGLSLLYYKRPDVESCLGEIGTTYSRHQVVLIKGMQYIGTGNTEVVEDILSDSFTGETDAFLESLALLCTSVIGIGDEVAIQMTTRLATSALILESQHLKSVLPLCYSILFPSSPTSAIIDVLEKSVNSGDSNTIIPSILALGIVGGGTLNGRIQKILDSQLSLVYKDSKASTVLKISQGLISLGKGMISLSPLLYDKSMISLKSFIGLFTTLMMFLEPTNSLVLNGNMYLIYLLCQSSIPKYVFCDKKINIRIGNPVNTVGIVGDPRRITAMQTHTTPVLIDPKERAEIEEESYTSYIEDIIVLKE